jgi:glycosyltransferase involved in cell wall biosynthesis
MSLAILAIGNGRSVHVQTRLAALSARGHKVSLLTENAGQDCPVPQIAPPPGSGTMAALKLLWRTIGTYPADLLHVHYAAGYGAWLAAASRRRPLVISVMGGDVLPEEQGGHTPASWWLTRRLLARADLVTSKSEYLSEKLRHLGVDDEKILPLVWGVDLNRFRRVDASGLRRRLGIPASAPIVLSPRILQPFYNIELIIEGFARAGISDAVLVVLEHGADPAYRSWLQERVAQLGLTGRIVFAGSVGTAEMPDFYSMADLVVGVPPSDGMPQTLLEAMACEAPSILGRLPRYQEMVQHGQTAWFVDLNADSLAQGIATLLADPTRRAAMAAAGLATVREKADLGRQIEALERRLDVVLARRRRAGIDVAMLAAIAIFAGVAWFVGRPKA